jgi:hypothetical protein
VGVAPATFGACGVGARRRACAEVLQRGGSGRTPHGGQRGRGQRWSGAGGRGGKPRCGQASVLTEVEERLWRGEPEGEAAKQRWGPGVTSSEEPRCSQTRRTSFTHAEVGAGATQRGFDAQRKTGGGGRPALMASQQEERTAELQDLEVWAE